MELARKKIRAVSKPKIPKKNVKIAESLSEGARLALDVVHKSSDALPPLQGVVGGLLKVIELVENTQSLQEGGHQLVDDAKAIVEVLVGFTENAVELQPNLRQSIKDFDTDLKLIVSELQTWLSKGKLLRFLYQRKHKDQLQKLNGRLYFLMHRFNVYLNLRTQEKIDKFHKDQVTLYHRITKYFVFL